MQHFKKGLVPKAVSVAEAVALRVFVVTMLLLALFFGVFSVTKSQSPHVSELDFTEFSMGNSGSVIPASCESVPPTQHSAGDNCPVDVQVNLGTVAAEQNPIEMTYSARLVANTGIGGATIQYEGESDNIRSYYVYNGYNTCDDEPRPIVAVDYVVTGAAQCYESATVESLASSGKVELELGPQSTVGVSVICVNGAFTKAFRVNIRTDYSVTNCSSNDGD